MRRLGFALLISLLSILHGFGAALPLTAKEVSLMLRSGYSTAAVMQELVKRHFVGSLSLDDENLLVKSGASAELIAALNKGDYALSAEQSAKAQAEIADQANRRAAEAQRLQQANAQYQAQVVEQRTAKPNNAAPTANVIADAMKGSLVKVDNDKLVPVSDDAIAKKKLIGLYFSAQWCGPCRKFTPELVEYYNRVITQQPDVEFVFVSADRSADAMQNYMRKMKMPWPALDFSKAGNPAIGKYAGKGIPCLVVVDQTGRVISHSYEGEKYLGPQKVLADLDTIFAAVAAKRVAHAN